MKKVKLFTGSYSVDFEVEINLWLNSGHYNIIDIKFSTGEGFYALIIYTDGK